MNNKETILLSTTLAYRPSQKMLFQWVLLSLLLFVSFSQFVSASTVMHPAIPILDEQGNHVLDSGKAYSSRMTCGIAGCHDYESITSAFHFDMGRSEAHDDFGAKRGVPQLVGPGYYGGYNCMGSNNPDMLAKKANTNTLDFSDLGSPNIVKRCIACHTGGGWMEKDRNGNRYDETDPASVTHLDGDYFGRGTDENNEDTSAEIVAQWDWKKSGVVEADCFLCHADLSSLVKTDPLLAAGSPAYNHFLDLRRYVTVGSGFFRYSNTAMLEFLNLNDPNNPHDSDRSLVNFSRDTEAAHPVHIMSQPNYALNLADDGQPILNWNAAAFDAERKVAIPMLRFPENENCMACHITSNSRRGFYGFGEGAEATYDEDGILEEDYKDDVHKDLTWTENGEEREIDNCNSCHARNFYKPSHANVDLNANHNFLKGNSDIDLRNDLDYAPNALSCVYCHDDADEPAIPSGQDSMLNAHLERWRASGDMYGYTEDSLSRITQTHLDIISCQACHISNKEYRGSAIQIMYRYRQEEDGSLKIIPYNSRARIYWKDRNSGRVLTKTERDSVLVRIDGQMAARIVDPINGPTGTILSGRISHGSLRYNDPDTYQGYADLRRAYNSLLRLRGIEDPDAVMVVTQPNQYIMNHNTRPAVESVQCEQCHSQTARGAFSALLSVDGILGESSEKTLMSIPDIRMYNEGMVILDLPYMKIDDNGVITENVADILAQTRINPSLTILNAAIATESIGKLQQLPVNDVANMAGLTSDEDKASLNQMLGGEAYVFSPTYGDARVRKVAIMPPVNAQTQLTFPTYQMQVGIAEVDKAVNASSAGFGGLFSNVFSLLAKNSSGAEVGNFGATRILVKLPYTGSIENLDEVKIITSNNGDAWVEVPSSDIALVRAQTNTEEGFVMFWTNHFSYYAVTNASVAATDNGASSSDGTAGDGGGGGGSLSWLLLIAAIWGLVFNSQRKHQ